MINRYSGIAGLVVAVSAVLSGCGGGSSSSNAPGINFGNLPTNAIVIRVLSVNSGSTAGGTPVTITGSGFAASRITVYFGQVAAPAPAVTSDNSLTVVTPAASAVGIVDIRIVNTAGVSAVVLADKFDYTAPTNNQPGATVYQFANSFAGTNTTSSETLVSPTAIAVDSSGVIWVADKEPADQVGSGNTIPGTARIWRFSQTGAVLSLTHLVPQAGGTNPNASIQALTADQVGFVYATDTQWPGPGVISKVPSAVYKFNSVGAQDLADFATLDVPSSSKPIPLGADDHGDVFVQTNSGNAMGLVQSSNMTLQTANLYTIDNASMAQGAMAVDNGSDAFLANHGVEELSASGLQELATSGGTTVPFDGIALDSLGYIYLSSGSSQNIIKLDPHGNNYATIGGSGTVGVLTRPDGVAVSGQDVWVADTENTVVGINKENVGMVFHYQAVASPGHPAGKSALRRP